MRMICLCRAGVVALSLCCTGSLSLAVPVAAPPATRPAASPPAAPAVAPATAAPAVAAPATRPAAPLTRPAAPVTRPAAAPAVAAPAAPATRPVAGGPLPATRPLAVKPGPEPLATMAELQEMFDQARYPDLLRQLPRVLILRGKAAEPYNKYDLWMMKFETHMRLKQQQAALSDLREAQEITDPKRINYCKGVELLIKRSKNFQYQPSPQKKEKPPTIDIIDQEKRKLALKAFLADELAVIGPKVEKALDGKSLANIAEAVKSLQGFDVLESAADANDESSRMIADLRSRGNAIMAKTVMALNTRTDDITRQANQIVTFQIQVPGFGGQPATWETRTRKRGLSNEDWRDLNDIIKTTDQLIPNIRGLAVATGGKIKDVEDLLTAAEELKRKADKALKSNYGEN